MPIGNPSPAKLWEGDVSFFSIDTNLIQAAGYNFDVGALNKLPKMLPQTMHLQLSEIMAEEVISHLMEPVNVGIEQFKAASSKLNRSAETKMIPIEKLFNELSVSETARATFLERIENYTKLCRGEILYLQDKNLAEKMFKLYFSSEAPFANNKEKKFEFPDAAALLSLEFYAEENQTIGILASNDSGWKNFAKTSEYLYCVDSIDELTALFEASNAHGNKVKKKLLKAISDIKSPLREILNNELKEHIEHASWSVDEIYATGTERLEGNPHNSNLISYTFDPNSTKAWNVENDPTSWIIEITASVTANIDIDIEFFVWDSIDREEVAMGSFSVSRETEVEVQVFLTCSGVQEGVPPEKWDIDVESAAGEYDIDVGEVEIDLNDDWH